jgi:glycosyltransferase involved in cell wall biosynthesis
MRVSILLPTYNRAHFLPAAFASIRAQQLTDWELVIVDDGSSDDTERVVHDARASIPQPIQYVKQANAGAYAARNRCLDLATAPYVAFFDSDDEWLPQHLANSVAALDAAPDVDWVYAACRIVDYGSKRVIDPDTFTLNGAPRPFLSLHTERRGAMFVIDDPRAVECALRDGLYCGLQNSVIRRSVFASARFAADFRNEAEDQLFVIRSLKRGHRLGYLNDVHVQYHVHEANSSAASADQSVDRQLAVYRPLVRGFEALAREFEWSPRERRELSQRLARDQFWHIGYAILWKHGRRREALAAYRAGLREWPWSWSCWKTYLAAQVRAMAGGAATPHGPGTAS